MMTYNLRQHVPFAHYPKLNRLNTLHPSSLSYHEVGGTPNKRVLVTPMVGGRTTSEWAMGEAYDCPDRFYRPDEFSFQLHIPTYWTPIEIENHLRACESLLIDAYKEFPDGVLHVTHRGGWEYEEIGIGYIFTLWVSLIHVKK